MTAIHPVIMCGGSGTRLWPLSRRLEPKQFQKLVGGNSLFQDTLLRFSGAEFKRCTVLVNASQEPRVRLELSQAAPENGTARIVAEPAMRSTAPAIAAAAAVIAADDPDAILLVVPSDHRIGRPDRLFEAQLSALAFVEDGGIALFGIRPTAPETGFGYICASNVTESGVTRVEAFVEKPPVERAIQMLTDPRYTWNSGIFMFKAATILEELARHAPAVLEAVEASVRDAKTDGQTIFLSSDYAQAPEISIDHAVMEHSQRLGVVPVSPEWNDVGSFEALWEVGDRNAEENVVFGDALLRDVRRSYVRAGRRLVSIVGLSNIVVVDTDDALLVASRAQSQDVKYIAQHLARAGHKAADQHVVQQQTGGHVRLVEHDAHYRVEHVCILPGRELQLVDGGDASTASITMLRGEASYSDGGALVRILAGQTQVVSNRGILTFVNPGTETVELMLTTVVSADAAEDADSERKVS